MKILVFVDGSDSSLRAVERAVAMADDGGELTILYVYPPRLDRDTISQFEIEPEDLDQRFASEIIDRVESILAEAGVRAETRYQQGPVAEVIVEVGRTGKFDLILMGGRQRMTGRLFELAEVVRRKSNLPVEVVR